MSRRRRSAALLLALASLLGPPAPDAGADTPVAYGPVPPAIDAVIADAEEQALANMALELLGQADPTGTRAPNLTWSRSLLVMLGDVGLKAAAQHLARGDAPDVVRHQLVAVIGASGHPDADVLLARAAQEPLPSLRMLAAQGLGRGRSAAAVPTLATLAADPRSGVRAAALRALFAIDSPQARAARIDLPADDLPELQAERLRRHRQVGDSGTRLLALASDGYHRGRRAAVRQEAARLLARPPLGASVETLERIVLEMGTDVLGAAAVRFALRVPARGYDPVTARRAAIEAALTLLGHDDASEAQKTRALERAVDWVANPVPMDPYRRDPIPEEPLRRRLPDVGPRLIEPVVRRLVAGDFYLTQHGVGLLRDLGPAVALPVFERLLGQPNIDAMHDEVALVMATWGQLGGEAAAGRLFAAELEDSVREELVEALRAEPPAWALPRLRGILAQGPEDLARSARVTLERRPEHQARVWLVEDVFTRAEDVDDRLPQLLRPVDDYAWAVLDRALTDARYVFQHEALVQLAKPAFRDPRGARLLATFEPVMAKPRHVQDYLYALINQDPMQAVRFVRERWADLPQPRSSLRLLQEIWGAAPIRAAVDLALGLVQETEDLVLLTKAGAVLAGHAGYRDEEIGALWRRTLTLPDDDIRTSTLLHIAYSGCPDLSDLLVPMLGKARQREALLGTSSELDEAVRAQQVLSALAHQPWPKVEAAVVDAILDPVTHPEVRVHAARIAIGRVSEAARTRLLAWLAGASADANAKARGASAGGVLQLNVALAVGTGGDAAVAGRLYRALAEEHAAFYTVRLRLDPSHLRTTAFDRRVLALATGVRATRHAPSIRAMTGLLFAPPYSTYASRAIRLQADGANRGGPAAGVLRTAPIEALLHADDRAIAVLAPDAEALLTALRGAPDDMLADAFAETLEAGRRTGALGLFPDMFLHRIAQGLADGREGPAKRRAADVVTAYAERLLPARGPADFALGRTSVAALTRAGRLEEAIARQRAVLQILTQRGYDDEDGLLWPRERARLDALRGRSLAARGMEAMAKDAFRSAVMRAPDDPQTLLMTAIQRAEAGFELQASELAARRAVTLHARSRHEPKLEYLDGLAQVLLRAGKPADVIPLLEARLENQARVETGRYFLHLALAYLATGDGPNAAHALEYALVHEPGLEPEIRADARFETWRADGRLQQIVRRAKTQRREGY